MGAKLGGYIPSTEEDLDAVRGMLNVVQGTSEFSQFTHLKGAGKGKLSTPYKSVLKFYPKAFEDEAQTTGDCTSHGTRNAADISRAVEIDIKKEPESWVARGATEAIYGYRGHSGAGMSPARATQFCVKYGLLLRQDYGFVDLSKYNSRIGTNWGRSGPPSEVTKEASKHPCMHFARIRSIEEARDALASGYGLHCGSQYGNNGKRDRNGVSQWNSSWNHDMCWGACDDTQGEMYFLVLNSWGIWNSGGHPEWGPIPGGSFLIPSGDADRMIRSGECWAVGEVKGWPPKNLPDYGTGSYL